MAKQHGPGTMNKDQNIKQLSKQGAHNDVELGSEYTVGNVQGQSQKKSGRQKNKK